MQPDKFTVLRAGRDNPSVVSQRYRYFLTHYTSSLSELAPEVRRRVDHWVGIEKWNLLRTTRGNNFNVPSLACSQCCAGRTQGELMMKEPGAINRRCATGFSNRRVGVCGAPRRLSEYRLQRGDTPANKGTSSPAVCAACHQANKLSPENRGWLVLQHEPHRQIAGQRRGCAGCNMPALHSNPQMGGEDTG